MKFGFTPEQHEAITACFRKFPEISEVILFGSRALGNYKPASDVDLYLKGENLSPLITARIFGTLNDEISVPLMFDVVMDPLSPDLKLHIDQHGRSFYKRAVTCRSV